MVLFKNVDVCDLKSILEKGILSMDECGNNNWDEGKRADNDTSVVYLFSPIGTNNSFPKYGTILLMIECDAKENKMLDADTHKNDYREYITERVLPEQIKKVIIPGIFRPYINIPDGIDVLWCELQAQCYDNEELKEADDIILHQFARTAELTDSKAFNFFRGINPDNTVIDLYNIEYKF